ncbi:hypothetical protein N9M55_02695, partial [Luminiphilus sp.]|nr:hypothetical protein [Luminiphilus sp.]
TDCSVSLGRANRIVPPPGNNEEFVGVEFFRFIDDVLEEGFMLEFCELFATSKAARRSSGQYDYTEL